LDAVLHPRALQDPKVLQQEGWHFELEDAKEPLTFKGVVYNEMKGKFYKNQLLKSAFKGKIENNSVSNMIKEGKATKRIISS
jgi:Zn-dependent M16 (insulinase) family peptidase